MASAPSPDLFGFLGGYSDRRREIEAQNMQLAQESAAREAEILKLLLNSPDPKIRGMAATGLITASGPQTRKGGLAGWMGQMETNPIFPKLLQYMQTPQITGHEQIPTPSLPARFRSPTAALTTAALPTVPPAQGSAALPDTQTTVAGEPPPVMPTQIPTPVAGPPPPPLTPAQEASRFEPGPPGDNPALFEPQGDDLRPSFSAETIGTPPGPPPQLWNEARAPIVNDLRQGAPIYGLPQAFPTVEDTTLAQYRGRAAGELQGQIEEWTKLYLAMGLSEREARR